jgi:hypothetical protein
VLDIVKYLLYTCDAPPRRGVRAPVKGLTEVMLTNLTDTKGKRGRRATCTARAAQAWQPSARYQGVVCAGANRLITSGFDLFVGEPGSGLMVGLEGLRQQPRNGRIQI